MQAWSLSTFLTTSCSAWLPATQHSDQGTCRSSIKARTLLEAPIGKVKVFSSLPIRARGGGGGGGGEFTANENSPPLTELKNMMS